MSVTMPYSEQHRFIEKRDEKVASNTVTILRRVQMRLVPSANF